VRFAEDIAGVTEIGAVGRGENMEITTYLEKAIQSEISGNIIDLCPVGALNSKPYQFHGRPWELIHTNTVDVMDALGSHIRVDSRGGQVFRIKPREMDEINEIWLSDKSRFSYDGLIYQRLDKPYVRDQNGELVPTSWSIAFNTIIDQIEETPGHAIAALAGDLVDCESMFLMKCLLKHVGSQHMDCRVDGAYADAFNPGSFVFNTSLNDIEKADVCILVGTNPRWEAPILNIRLRRGVKENNMKVFRVGFTYDLTYPVEDIGNNIALLNDILEGKGEIAKALSNAQRPAIIIGQAALRSAQGAVILNTCARIAEMYRFVQEDGWNGFNVLHTAAGRVGGLDIGFVPGKSGFDLSEIITATHDGRVPMLFLLGVDNIAEKISKRTFVVYIGHHGDKGAQRADVVLPGAAYTEKEAIYVNTEGRSQYAYKAVDPPGEAWEDWRIFAELLRKLSYKKSYNSIQEVRKDLQQDNREFSENCSFSKRHWNPNMGRAGKLVKEELSPIITNFYVTNIITQYSTTMAQCTEEILKETKI
jgi:NADH-quinone oxidoreductase subunit G